MKKVINGKLYNTETAEYLGGYVFSYQGDFRHIDEDLYRTEKGTFFLYGEGGPMTRYRVEVGQNSWSGSSDIILLTEEEAEEWVEEHLSAKDYIEIFGEPEEG